MSGESDLRRRIEELEAELQVLREKQALPYRSVLEDMSELVVRWKPDGARLFVNDAYCRLFRASREELIGSSFWPLITEADRGHVRRRIERLSPESPVSTGRHRAHGPGDALIWMEWVDRAIFDSDGRVIELQSVGRDITARVALEEQARRVEKADAVARLSAAIAHDLNNLLTVLAGGIELLQLQAGPSREIEIVRIASVSIGDLVQKLGALRFGASVERQCIDLNARIHRLLGLLTEVCGERVALNCNLLDAPCAIQGDPTQIDQVLLNLVKNAVEAMPRGGAVNIETRVDVADSGSRAVLAVSDTGEGIQPAILPRIFEPNVSTKRAGRGLGLATVKTIVDEHCGQIRVSTSNAGAHFELDFPADPVTMA